MHSRRWAPAWVGSESGLEVLVRAMGGMGGEERGEEGDYTVEMLRTLLQEGQTGGVSFSSL